MKCKHIESLLFNSLLERGLSQKSEQDLKEHINECPDCKRTYQSLEKTINTLKQNTQPEPLPEFWDELNTKILNATYEEVRKVSFPVCKSIPRWSKRVSLLAASILLILATIFILNSNENAYWSRIIGDARYSFSNAFLIQGWDPSLLHVEIQEEQLQKIYQKIEGLCKQRLEEYLQLDNEKMEKLYPLIHRFGKESYEYGIKYTQLLFEMTGAVKDTVKTKLENTCQKVRMLEEKWNLFRKSYLDDVSKILDTEQYARFLIFTFRFRREILKVIVEVCRNSN